MFRASLGYGTIVHLVHKCLTELTAPQLGSLKQRLPHIAVLISYSRGHDKDGGSSCHQILAEHVILRHVLMYLGKASGIFDERNKEQTGVQPA